MGIAPTQTVTLGQTLSIEIAPELVDRLAAILSTYTDLKDQADMLYDAMDVEKAKMLALLQEAGIEKVVIDKTPLAVVGGYSSHLDKVKFVQLGGSLMQLENATTKKPKKKYLSIGKEKPEAE